MGAVTIEQLKDIVKEIVGDTLKDWQEKEKEQINSSDTQKILAEIDKLRKENEKLKIQGKNDKGIMAARCIRALAAAKGDVERAAKWAEKQWDDGEVAKALMATDSSAGGLFVPDEWSTEVIELLRPVTVFRRMNPIIIPMDHGNMTISGLAGGATSYYIGESQNMTKSQQQTRAVRLSWKKLATLVPISNDLLRFSSPSVDAIVRDDLISSMAEREDITFLRGAGTEYTPKGILNWSLAANKFNANGTVNLVNVTVDLATAILKLKQSNVRFLRPGWIFSPRTEMHLRTVRDGNGNLVFKSEMDGGRLFGFPFGVTTQIPENLGGGTDESEVYFLDFADVVIGESKRISIDVSSEAAYFDNTQVVSAFSKDETVMRTIAEHDLAMRHKESIAIIQAVKWKMAES